MNIWRVLIFILYSLIACFYRVFLNTSTRRPIPISAETTMTSTTTFLTTYTRPTTMPQIRIDWLEKFGLIKRTSPSTSNHHVFRQRT